MRDVFYHFSDSNGIPAVLAIVLNSSHFFTPAENLLIALSSTINIATV